MSDAIVRPPLPTDRPRFPAGTGLRDEKGRSVGGRYMSNSVIEAVTSKIEMPAEKSPSTIPANAPSAPATPSNYRVERTPTMSRTRALANFAARNIVGSIFGDNSGIYRDVSRYAPRRNIVERLVPEYNEQPRPERVVSVTQNSTAPQRVGNSILRGNTAQDAKIASDISSMSKDMSDLKDNSRRTLRDIGVAKDTLLRIERLFPLLRRDDEGGRESSSSRSSSWLGGLAAAGSVLLTSFQTLTTAIKGIISTIGGLAGSLGKVLVSAVSSLFSPAGVIGRALVAGAKLLFSGPVLAGIIGAGALAAIGSAIVRAMSMSPEERAAAQMRAEEQARAGREQMESTPTGSPGQAAARGIARSYNISSNEYGDIQDILMNPREGENATQRAERERLNELQRQSERNAPGGNVQLAPGVAEYVSRVRSENAERAIEAGTAENRAIAEALSPMAGFEENNQTQNQQAPQRVMNTESSTQATPQRMMPTSNEQQILINSRTRRNNVREVNLIENYAAMRGIERPTGGILEDGKVVAVLDRNRRRVDVTDISRRDYSRAVEGDWTGTPQQPELAPVVNDNRSQTIAQNANQPNNIIINNQSPPPAAGPVAMQGQQGGGGGLIGRARARAAALPSQPIRPSEAASPAVSR